MNDESYHNARLRLISFMLGLQLCLVFTKDGEWKFEWMVPVYIMASIVLLIAFIALHPLYYLYKKRKDKVVDPMGVGAQDNFLKTAPF